MKTSRGLLDSRISLTVTTVLFFSLSSVSTHLTKPVSLQKADRVMQPATLVYFTNQSLGWAKCGEHRLCATSNGGHNWYVVTEDPRFESCYGFTFVDQNHGWAIIDQRQALGNGYRGIYRTADGGRRWIEVRAMDTPTWSLQFLNDQVGYVSSRWEYIVKTMDGGNTWQKLPAEGAEANSLPLAVFEGCSKLTFLNESAAWGYGLWVWRTANSGGKWAKVSSEHDFGDDLLVDGIFLDERFGCVSSGEHSQAVWCTHDGQTWTPGVFEVEADVRTKQNTAIGDGACHSVNFIDHSLGWTVCGETLFHSVDGGRNWRFVSRSAKGIGSVKFLDGIRGWALDKESNLIFTTDGGRTWHLQAIDQ
jgi:photosystem II stability/assembly factor-like uncharacterized protein